MLIYAVRATERRALTCASDVRANRFQDISRKTPRDDVAAAAAWRFDDGAHVLRVCALRFLVCMRGFMHITLYYYYY